MHSIFRGGTQYLAPVSASVCLKAWRLNKDSPLILLYCKGLHAALPEGVAGAAY
jgi:hypothetical protein